MSQRRVVVTGLGIVSPVGNTLADAWDSISNGRSGIGNITRFDTSAFATQICGEVRDFDPKAWVPPKDVKKMGAFIHYGIAAATMAASSSSTCAIARAWCRWCATRMPRLCSPTPRSSATSSWCAS